jgi:hypothetical protein
MKKIIISESQVKSLVEQLLEPKEIMALPHMDSSAEQSAGYVQNLSKEFGKLNPDIHLNIGYPNDYYFRVGSQYFDHSFLFYKNDKKTEIVLTIALKNIFDGFQIAHVYGTQEIRGQEIGVKIYEELSNTFKKPLFSGEAQTPNSRYGIWNKLLLKYPNRVVLFNTETNENIKINEKNTDMAYDDIHKVNYLLKFLP